MIILLIAIGNSVIYKDKFAVIEGSIECSANTGELSLAGKVTYTPKLIDFPVGFNKDNCVVLSFGGKNFDDARGYGYANGGVTESTDLVLGTEPKRIELGSNLDNSKIRIMVGNISTSPKTKYYKIVLMKIK